MPRSTLSIILLLSALSFSGFPAPTHAFWALFLVVHCPGACTVYQDGKVVASLPKGGVKQLSVNGGVQTTILISRPGKPDWVRKIRPTSDMSINPDAGSPVAIPDDPADSRSSSPSTPSPDNSVISDSRSSQQPLPEWLADRQYVLSDSESEKDMDIREGTNTCPISMHMDIGIEVWSNGLYRLEYEQTMGQNQTENIDDPGGLRQFEWCLDHRGDPEFNQNWSINVPIRLTNISDNLLSFTAEMERCHNCKLPPNLNEIAGDLRREESGATLDLGAPLNLVYHLELFKRDN